MTENTNPPSPARNAANTDRPVKQLHDIDIQALVDGALDAAPAAEIRAMILHDCAARARYRELLKQKRLLIAWWRQLT